MERKRLQTNVHVHPPPGLDLHFMHHVKYALPEQCDANVPKLLTKLREFLVAMLREVYDDVEVCRQIVAAKMQEWSMRIDPLFSYEHAQLLLHIRMWNIIGCYENGMAKQMEFIHWCRKTFECATTSCEATYYALANDICTNSITTSGWNRQVRDVENTHQSTCQHRKVDAAKKIRRCASCSIHSQSWHSSTHGSHNSRAQNNGSNSVSENVGGIDDMAFVAIANPCGATSYSTTDAARNDSI